MTLGTTPTSVRPPTISRLAKGRELAEHDPGLLRDVVEKTSGVIGAVTHLPRSIASGTVVGGYHGRKRGLDPDQTTDPKEVAMHMFVGNTVQSTAVGAIGALVVSGPGGAAASVGKDLAIAGAKYAVYKRFGKSGSMSRRIAANIDQKVEGGEGAVKGTGKGAWAGATGAAKGGAVIGFRQGRGTASGLIEGFSELDDEFALARRPAGGALRKVATGVGAGVNGLLSAPAGLVQGLLKNDEERSGSGTRLALTAAGGAAMGATAGLVGGPVGALIGAGVGAVTGLVSAATNDRFSEKVEASLQRAAGNDTDMGDEETNRRRDLVQNAIVGTVSGVRQGWDATVDFLD